MYDLQRKMGKGSALTSTAAFAPEHSTSTHDQSTELLQFSGNNGVDAVQETAAEGLKGSSGPLPYAQQIQQSFGHHDVSGVQAHVGGQAKTASEAIGAEAYATGNAVAFRESPSLHTAAHEAAHVVQQRRGVQLKGGVGEVGDRYEQHADAVADLVVQGKSAETLLSEMSGGTTSRPSAQRDVRGSVQKQRDARGVDSQPAGGGPAQHAVFTTHDGKPTALHHDHGHLDDGNGNLDPTKREEPTWGDRFERLKWIAKLEAAELLRPDLVDATSAYRHFLFGGGRQRDIHYQRYIDNDSSGATTMQSILEDARFSAIKKHDELMGTAPQAGSHTFKLKTGRISAGGGGDARFPYPATENWQKAIGAHQMWLELDVTVKTTEVPGKGPPQTCVAPVLMRDFDIKVTAHIKDMYNFNPGMADIATGIPDSANGRFEITGLGQEFLSVSTITQTLEFTTDLSAATRVPSGGALGEVGRSARGGRAEGSRGRAAER